MMRSCFVWLMSLLAATASRGADLQVREGFPPPFYNTIQSAIEAAVPGDNVLVYPGTYNERINFLGKDITVRGVGPLPSLHKIDGVGDGNQLNGALVTFNSGETRSARLEGFTITNGQASNSGGGVYISEGSSPTIVNCVISDCFAPAEGGGLFITGGSVSLEGVKFQGNRGLQTGGGMSIQALSQDALVTNCEFENCNAIDSSAVFIEPRGGGIFIKQGDGAPGKYLRISQTDFLNCSADGTSDQGCCNGSSASPRGGAICASASGGGNYNIEINECSFVGNSTKLVLDDNSNCCGGYHADGQLQGGTFYFDNTSGSVSISDSVVTGSRLYLSSNGTFNSSRRTFLSRRRGVAISSF
ncbi:MAG: right-handed parallel beta-helix repeat-containing protein, partial [Bacteroidota bacterium]|nr:right-handed parallel beta-helix repeat-containing protein [Bacteroidota bacterium]